MNKNELCKFSFHRTKSFYQDEFIKIRSVLFPFHDFDFWFLVSKRKQKIYKDKLVKDSQLRIVQNQSAETISIFRGNETKPILTQNAKANFRPYLHPLVAPDGKGVLTEYSPGHHKHQTGIYWGYTRVNGRDYFHHPDAGYWRRVSAKVVEAKGVEVKWQTVYDLLDSTGTAVLQRNAKLVDAGKRREISAGSGMEW